MKKIYLNGLFAVAIVCLSGCSSKPEANDIAEGLKEFWGPCKMVRPIEIKKTNGMDRGDSYDMAISYKLEFVRDIDEEEIWASKIKPVDMTSFNEIKDSRELFQKMQEANKPYSLAQERMRKFWAMNCPKPQSTLFFKYLESIVSNNSSSINKRSIKAGESLELTTEYKMIKSEKGWIAEP